MIKIDQLFAEYAESHQNQTNKFYSLDLRSFNFLYHSIYQFIPFRLFAPYFGCINIAILLHFLVSIFTLLFHGEFFNYAFNNAFNGTFCLCYQCTF